MIKIMKRKTYNKLQKDMQNEVKDPIHEDTFSRWFNDWKNDNPLPVTCNDSVTKRNG